jgi:hypothetical protein
MPDDQTFEQRLKSHTGGLVRVFDEAKVDRSLRGKIGLLMSARHLYTRGPVRVELLIDGSVKKLLLYPSELEFLGADDVS